MATMIKSYEVASVSNCLYMAFVMYDYECKEAIAVCEYSGGYKRVEFHVHSKDGIEYAAIEHVANMLDDATNEKVDEMDSLVDEVSARVDAYLYAD